MVFPNSLVYSLPHAPIRIMCAHRPSKGKKERNEKEASQFGHCFGLFLISEAWYSGIETQPKQGETLD